MRSTLIVIFITLSTIVSAQSLSNGAKLLFANARTKLSVADKNDIFLQSGFYYDAGKNELYEKKDDVVNLDTEIFLTDMNKDGSEEVFISSNSVLTAYIKQASKYERAGSMESFLLEVYSSGHMGYFDMGNNETKYRFNGKSYSPFRGKTGARINDFDLYSLNYFAPMHIISNPDIIAKYIFKETQTTLSDNDKKQFTAGYFLRYREGRDTILIAGKDHEEMDKSGLHLQILPTDLNKDGSEEIFITQSGYFMHGNSTYTTMYVKNKTGRYIEQKTETWNTVYVRGSKHGGYPDLVRAFDGNPDSEIYRESKHKFDIYRWDGNKYILFEHKNSQPFEKTDLPIDEVSYNYTSSLNKENVAVLKTPAQRNDQVLTSVNENKNSAVSILFDNIKTTLSEDEKAELMVTAGITMENLSAKTKKGKTKFVYTILPADINNDGNEDIFIRVTTHLLGLPLNNYYFYTKDGNGKFLACPGKIGINLRATSRINKGYPDLISVNEVWTWNGRSYSLQQRVTAGAKIPSVEIEAISSKYTSRF